MGAQASSETNMRELDLANATGISALPLKLWLGAIGAKVALNAPYVQIEWNARGEP